MLSESAYATIRYVVECQFRLHPNGVDVDSWQMIECPDTCADDPRVFVWQMERKTMICAPRGMMNIVIAAMYSELAADQLPGAFIAPAFWRAALGELAARIIGPTYQGCCDTEVFQPADTQGARLLTLTDHRALRAFIADCPPDDWNDSAISLEHAPIFGLERDGALIAVASAPRDKLELPVTRSVGVVTLPAWRGKGAGRALVSALTAHCLADRVIPRYQTLRANTASIAIANALGYEDVATSLIVRLR